MDTFGHCIQKFTSNGDFIKRWEVQGTSDGQFQWPGGIAVESDDDLVVTDTGNYRIQKFTSDGNFIRKWGIQSIGDNHNTDNSFGGAAGVAIDSDDNNYVADSALHVVKKFDRNGVFIKKWGSEVLVMVNL